MIYRFLLPALFGALLTSGVYAQTSDLHCDDSNRLKKTLHSNLGAERQGMGLRDPDTAMELWVTETTGEWLLVHHYANGTSCIVAIGEHWAAENPTREG